MSATRAVGWRNVKIMEIVKKTKDWLVINKPVGVPSQHDPSGDKDAMSLCAMELKELGEDDSLWLVHRLDRVVGGVMVFARTKYCAQQLSSNLGDDSFSKEYLAVVEGEAEGGELFDYIFRDSRVGKAFVSDRLRQGFKEARLTYRPLASATVGQRRVSLVSIRLHTGRFHQIRAQFSSRKMPLLGDGKYGSRDKGCRHPALFACKLSFELGGKSYSVSALPQLDAYPWNLFRKEVYGNGEN